MHELNGKTALITGGASGIGLAIAKALAKAGMKIALTDRDADRLQEAKQTLAPLTKDVVTVAFDVSDYAAWEQTLKQVESQLGAVELLCNSAGIGGGTLLHEDDPIRWKTIIEVNLMGTYYGIRTVLPRMLERGTPAHIVNIASLSGLRSNGGMSSYDASKHAVVGMSDSLRQELAGKNVGLSVVYPGMTNTGFIANSQQIFSEKTNVVVSQLSAGIADLLKGGMNPDKLAERVVKAIRAGEYHVFTHADHKPLIARHFSERLDAFSENADPDYHENLDGLLAKVETGKNEGHRQT